jgi:hypothetical protein
MRLLLHYQLLTLLPFLLREFQIGDASIVAVDSLSSEGVTSTVSTSRGTCQFRTINYLTHGNVLPSVCLKYSRPPFSASGTTIDLPFSTTETIESDSERQFITTATTPTASAGLKADAVVSKKEFEDKGPLDESSFLSFEDWKKQRLEKEGPLDLVLGEQRPQILKDGDQDRRPGGISEALEALGDDDGEIQADFGAFITNRQDAAVSRTRDDYLSGKKLAQNTGGGDVKYEKQKHRIKDVGKTCKERFNFASIDAGGQIMKTNSEAKSASALLSENRDIYMLNICHAKNKFLVIELSELILVETVAIANFEFFSSTFRQFRVLVSDRYSVELEQWVELGIFEAKNSRDIQAFLIKDPRIWARYLRMEFLSHYGNEFYCPVSLLRVHGRTMIQEIQDTLNMEQLSDVEGDGGGHVRSRDPKINPKGVSEKFEENGVDEVPQQLEQTLNSTEIKRDIHLNHTTTPWAKSEPIVPAIFDRSPSRVMCLLSESPTAILTTQRKILSDTILPNCVTQSGTSGVICLSHIPMTTELATPAADPLTQPEMQNASFTSPSLRTTVTASAHSGPTLAENVGAIGAIRPSVVSAVHIPQPTTQESFFKSVSKRLQQLEANSTLSLKYIEEQSRILRDAFAKVEKRQLSKTTSFLENLNDTVIEELRKFNRQYEQIWQSTVVELETQRDQSQREITAVSTRLNILADELVFQKRMSIIQSILLLLCLGLIIFSRVFAGLDMPIVQSIVTRSRSASRATVDGFNNDSVIQRADSFHSRSWLDPEYGRHKSDESTLSMRSNSQSAPSPLQLSEYSEETHLIRADGQDYLLRQDTGDPAPQSIGR